jgi:acetyltransferase-like isoleucine patch superfamily enzyme
MIVNSSSQRAPSVHRVKLGMFMLVEMFLRVVVHPKFRALLLRQFGATVGRNVRVYEARFINLGQGFRNLVIEDDVHVGADTLIDLQGKVTLRRGATLSPRVTVLTHNDPGSIHGSPLCLLYPPATDAVVVGEFAWVGAGAIVLAGTRVGELSVVGAGSLISGSLEPRCLYVGTPARRVRQFTL